MPEPFSEVSQYSDRQKRRRELDVVMNEVFRDTAVVPRCHPLFVRPMPYYLPDKAFFKLCYIDYVMLGLIRFGCISFLG